MSSPADIHPRALIERAQDLQARGLWREALAAYDAVIALKPGLAAAHLGRGDVLYRLNRLDQALASLDRAAALKPEMAGTYVCRGAVLLQQGSFAAAAAAFETALSIDPGIAAAHHSRASALFHLGRFAEAEASYAAAIGAKPGMAAAHVGRGNALQELGAPAAALASFDRALALRPGDSDALFGRARSLAQMGRFGAAVSAFDTALTASPTAAGHYARGNVLQKLRRYEEAIASYDRAVALRPDHVNALLARAGAFLEILAPEQARESWRLALAQDPEEGRAVWGLALGQIPALRTGDEDLPRLRESLAAALDALDAWFTPERLPAASRAVTGLGPFYLAYQELDNKPLLARYGALCGRIMRHWQQTEAVAPAPLSPAGKIRVGVVGDKIRDHSVWNVITKGLVAGLDRAAFELHVFHLSAGEDAETAFARGRADSFTQGNLSLGEWARAICDRRIEALIYPDAGMDQLAAQLAATRLAPVQAVSWGHPETTGLPTIDYFLSAEDLESPEADAFYSEKLVRLPNLGVMYVPQDVPPADVDLAALGLDPARPLLLCPGTPFKYGPEYDRVLAEIARRLPAAQLVFFRYADAINAALERRLGRAFAAKGLRFEDHATTLEWLEKGAFHGLMRKADAYLDTLGFSGFTTAMQAVACDLPVVTREGRFLRGRLASGINRRLGLGELVARDEDEYVALAERLVLDRDYRRAMGAAIGAGKGRLYGDPAPVRALEAFLTRLCRPGGRKVVEGEGFEPS